MSQAFKTSVDVKAACGYRLYDGLLLVFGVFLYCDVHFYYSDAIMLLNDERHDISTLWFCGMEKVSLPPRGGDLDLLLKRCGACWIFTLQTLSPRGLNDELPLNVML